MEETRLRYSVSLLSVGPGMIRGLRLHWMHRTDGFDLLSPALSLSVFVMVEYIFPIFDRFGDQRIPQGEVSLFHVALINMRSLVNKTFILY